MVFSYLSTWEAPPHAVGVSKWHACMTMPVANVELLHGARLHAEALHVYIRQFGQMTLLAVPPVQNTLALLLLFEHQPGDRLLALLPVSCVTSDRNYTYPVRLKELFSKRLAG